MKRPHLFLISAALALASGAASAIDDSWGWLLHPSASDATPATSGPAAAASSDNSQQCQDLNQNVKDTFNQAVQDRVPKEDPSTFVQNNYDVKGILAQDVTSGLAKLAQLNFGSILDSLVQKGMETAMEKAQQTFTNRMNGVLSSFGVQGTTFQQLVTSTSSAVNQINQFRAATGTGAAPAAAGLPAAAPQAAVQAAPATRWTPYGAVPQ